MTLSILYRDDHLIAIDKPSGLLVHRSMIDRHETRFAVQMLRDQIGRHVHPVHRLDKGTSGVLVFALDRDNAARLGAAFESRDVIKRYLAIVRGHPSAEGVIDHPLERRTDPYERTGSNRSGPGTGEDSAPALGRDATGGTRPDCETARTTSPAIAQPARTRYTTLATVELPYRVDRYPFSRYALVQLEPETGRRHQLRRHLKHIAHPIIGDATHGKGKHNRLFAELFASRRLLLACTRMAFRHPVDGRLVDILCPPAEDFMRVIDALGWSDVFVSSWNRCTIGGSTNPTSASA